MQPAAVLRFACRGVASKIMAGLGFVKGQALGRSKKGAHSSPAGAYGACCQLRWHQRPRYLRPVPQFSRLSTKAGLGKDDARLEEGTAQRKSKGGKRKCVVMACSSHVTSPVPGACGPLQEGCQAGSSGGAPGEAPRPGARHSVRGGVRHHQQQSGRAAACQERGCPTCTPHCVWQRHLGRCRLAG